MKVLSTTYPAIAEGKNKRINLLSEIFFFLGYGILIIWQVLYVSLYAQILPNFTWRAFEYLVYTLMFLRFTTLRFLKMGQIMLFITLPVLTYIVSTISERKILFCIIILLLGSFNIEFKRMVNFSRKVLLVLCCFIIISCKIGMLQDYIFSHDVYTSTVMSHSLGFTYYSYLPIYFMYFTMMTLYCKKKKASIFDLLLLTVMNIYIYTQCHKRINFLMSMLIIMLYLMIIKIEWPKFKAKLWGWISILLIPIMEFVFINLSSNFSTSNSTMDKINTIFNGRLYYSYEAILNYPISLFGNYIKMVGGTEFYNNTLSNLIYFYIDSGYLYILLAYGVIVFILVTLAYVYIFHSAYKTNNKVLYIWVLITVFYGLAGNTFLDIWYNPLILYISFNIFNQMKFKHKIVSEGKCHEFK